MLIQPYYLYVNTKTRNPLEKKYCFVLCAFVFIKLIEFPIRVNITDKRIINSSKYF